MRRIMFLLIVCSMSLPSFASQCDAMRIRIVYPNPSANHANIKPCSKQQNKRRVIMAEITLQKAEDERIEKIILDDKFARQQAKIKIDPEKDEYKKALTNKALKEEADKDPDVAAVRAKYVDDYVRNDFKEWKENANELERDEFAKWRKDHPLEKKQPEAKDFNIEKYLIINENDEPKPRAKRNEIIDE